MRLSKLGQHVTETLEMVPRVGRHPEHAREILLPAPQQTRQPPPPFHVVPRWLGWTKFPRKLLFEKFGQQQPLNGRGRLA